MSLAAEIVRTVDRAERFRRRYGERAPQAHGPWSETLDVLLDHKTARAYLPDPVPAGVIETLVAAAQSAPTSSNLQAWSVVAVQDPARKARLAQLAGTNKHIEEAPLFLVWVADLARPRAIALQNDAVGDGLDYLESFLIAAIDAALAAQNAVVAANSLGLGSCYIGGIRNNPEGVALELGLPPESVAVFGLTIGYPDPTRESELKPRLPQSRCCTMSVMMLRCAPTISAPTTPHSSSFSPSSPWRWRIGPNSSLVASARRRRSRGASG